ncbi:MAG: ribulose-phosphate 3-epimerase [Dysgonamonadaceae bacterium]|jgi:ribulose-phosphate 3-epimerase|nr:ribulose-phosphate 3-epimerase [Dysgonamonadaceae bacterium]MDD3355370.1 ribulose-phosphate 3-epimerase [Dysgonamonadaceae bacterium]MDD3726964.1 ribulose-phosphate 3-epimerase [Dysgonamonadaceae bacterium]MDD4245748.1 ribulose-phosphate 3-epimerase [Dysgonamonadaceae bacterium]MDD4604860.1 ribulose-phosphate 3-epimerase [Dysgonamonadaceae bacterium]
MSHLVAPSILAGDFANLRTDIEMLNTSEADWIHVDIMDGVFVPNISFGFLVLEAINKLTSKPLDVHLMIIKPDRYISRFKKAGASNLIVHLEACVHLHRTIQAIKQEGMHAGVALNPHTSVNNLEDIIQDIDQVLIMSVNPGFGGQKFIEHTYRKVEYVRNLILKSDSKALIGVDGGVDSSNALKLIELGADVLVAGSSIFRSDNPIKTIAALKAL